MQAEAALALLECRLMKDRVYLEQGEGGMFVATCPTLPARPSRHSESSDTNSMSNTKKHDIDQAEGVDCPAATPPGSFNGT